MRTAVATGGLEHPVERGLGGAADLAEAGLGEQGAPGRLGDLAAEALAALGAGVGTQMNGEAE